MNAEYYETSAISAQNIELAFINLGKKLLAKKWSNQKENIWFSYKKVQKNSK